MKFQGSIQALSAQSAAFPTNPSLLQGKRDFSGRYIRMSSGMPEASPREPSSLDGTTTIEDRISYVVQAGETMNAIAAKFDLTPSELARLNRIPTNSMVFPGRKLSIPVKRRKSSGQTNNDSAGSVSTAADAVVASATTASDLSTAAAAAAAAGQELSDARQRGDHDEAHSVHDKSASSSQNETRQASSSSMGDAHRAQVPINHRQQQQQQQNDILSGLMIPPRAGALSSSSSSSPSAQDSSSVMPSRARLSHVLKINARHITDGQGVVTGTLLITPNNIMFSPNVSDLIVIEHGTEHYEVTAPIDMIAGAALYTDIAIMRTKMHQKPIVCNIPVQVYHSEEQRPKTPPSSPNRLSATSAAGAGGSGESRTESESGSGSEPVSPRPTKTPPSSPIVGGGAAARKESAREENAAAAATTAASQRTESKDMEEPEVFAALEKLLPKPAQPQENSMLYLCLRMGKPLNKVVKVPAVALGRRKVKCEYWFGIPRNRVDEVYKFFQRNYPEKYGDVIELNMQERGFEDIESDDEDDIDKNDDGSSGVSDSNHQRRGGDHHHHDVRLRSQDGSSSDDSRATPDTPKSATDGALTGVLNRVGSFKNPFKLPRFFEGPNTPHPSFSSCEWEVIALKDDSNSPAATSNLLNPLTPDEILLPEMIDDSEILDEEHRKMLYKVIPARAEGYAWRLVYSTTRNGFSLKTFYREMSRHDGPVLLAIADTEGALFGAFASTTIHPSDHFYGTGEMFLWTFHPSFNKYSWSGENQYFIKGNQDSLVFGSGDGEFGLYLDGDLYYGRSSPCKTFNNEVLSQTNDFVIKSLEAWGFF